MALTARTLARHHGLDESKAFLAGMLHDAAREMTEQQLLALAEKEGVTLDPVDRLAPVPHLHGLAAAVLAREKLGIEDPEILAAIASHTLGHPRMSPLELLVFVADWIEPGRDEHPGLAEVRELAYHSLTLAARKVLDHTFLYLIEREKLIHPLALAARNGLLLEERDRIDR